MGFQRLKQFGRESFGDRLIMDTVVIAGFGEGNTWGIEQIATLIKLIRVKPKRLVTFGIAQTIEQRAAVESAIASYLPFGQCQCHQVASAVSAPCIEMSHWQRMGGLPRCFVNENHARIDNARTGGLLSRHELR